MLLVNIEGVGWDLPLLHIDGCKGKDVEEQMFASCCRP